VAIKLIVLTAIPLLSLHYLIGVSVMQQRKEFYTIIDDEWAKFWSGGHVTAPKVKSKFLTYIENAFGIVDKTTEDRFEKMIHKLYPHEDCFYHFDDMIRHVIVMFIENTINGVYDADK